MWKLSFFSLRNRFVLTQMRMFFNALKDLFRHTRCRNELFDIGRGKSAVWKNKCTRGLSTLNAFVARFGARTREVRLQLFALNFFTSLVDASPLHEYSGVHYGDAMPCHCCLPEQPLLIRVWATKFWKHREKRGLSRSSRSVTVLIRYNGLNRMRDRIVPSNV